MQSKSDDSRQRQFLYEGLKEMLNHQEPLYKLAGIIDWEQLDKEFEKYYVDFGRPAKPTRLMISLLLLKQMKGLGDETAVVEWTHNPYWQYLSGAEHFQWNFPCEPSDLVHFRKRIGTEGMQRILQLSVDLHEDKEVQEQEVVVDTTAQEKNITYPTDTKLHKKIVQHCVNIAKETGIQLRRSYKRTIPKLICAQRGRNHPRGHKKAIKAAKKLKTIAGRLVREIGRKMPEHMDDYYSDHLTLYKRVLAQKRGDTNKIYSLHEPHVYCMSKGKAHKKYEYGSKVSIAMTKTSGIIVSALNFEQNIYDGKTLSDVLEDIEKVTDKRPKTAIVDLGYQGRRTINGTQVITSRELRKSQSKYQRRKTRQRLRRRAAIEPVIGHLKSDFKLARNYLRGVVGDHINVLLAATAFNIRKWLRKTAFLFCDIFSCSKNRFGRFKMPISIVA